VNLSDEDKQQILSGMQELPPYPEVDESLSRLREAGFRHVEHVRCVYEFLGLLESDFGIDLFSLDGATRFTKPGRSLWVAVPARCILLLGLGFLYGCLGNASGTSSSRLHPGWG
jgi:hypothetical protein